MTMDPFTKKVLRDFWKKNDVHERTIDGGFSGLEEDNDDDEQEIGIIFNIETNLFDYKTPLCTKFNEFNYLLKVDQELFTYDVERTENYDFELNGELEELWDENGGPYEIEKLQDYWWKVNKHECSPFVNSRNYIRGPYANYYRNFLDMDEQEGDERCELFDDKERPVCYIKKFEMIKYSFGQDEEYVAVKEDEYDDLTSTSKDACQAYQEIFRMMDEGWMNSTYLCLRKKYRLNLKNDMPHRDKGSNDESGKDSDDGGHQEDITVKNSSGSAHMENVNAVMGLDTCFEVRSTSDVEYAVNDNNKILVLGLSTKPIISSSSPVSPLKFEPSIEKPDFTL
nr:hypothetical protein [Tanacetum cinerariifolium]